MAFLVSVMRKMQHKINDPRIAKTKTTIVYTTLLR